MHVPGHTPACVAYVVGDAAFVGDTLFMPDYGTARCDFPGGSARALWHSIRRLLDLPPETRVFTAHDYKAPGRDSFAWESTVAEQRARNPHVKDGTTEEEFIAMREARDAKLAPPPLLVPSIQVNMRAGRFPPAESNGVRYLRIPVAMKGAPVRCRGRREGFTLGSGSRRGVASGRRAAGRLSVEAFGGLQVEAAGAGSEGQRAGGPAAPDHDLVLPGSLDRCVGQEARGGPGLGGEAKPPATLRRPEQRPFGVEARPPSAAEGESRPRHAAERVGARGRVAGAGGRKPPPSVFAAGQTSGPSPPLVQLVHTRRQARASSRRPSAAAVSAAPSSSGART